VPMPIYGSIYEFIIIPLVEIFVGLIVQPPIVPASALIVPSIANELLENISLLPKLIYP